MNDDQNLKSTQQTIEDAEKLIKEINDNPIGIGLMQVENIYLPFKSLFSKAAQKALSIKAMSTIHQRKIHYINSLKTIALDRVTFFGKKCDEDSILPAVQKLAIEINELASKGFVTAALCPLIYLKLASEPHELSKYLVLSYIAISDEGREYLAKEKKFSVFEEGALPPEDTFNVNI